MTRGHLKEESVCLEELTKARLEVSLMLLKCFTMDPRSYPEAARNPLYLLRADSKSSSSMLVILSLLATPLIIEGDLSERFGVHEEGGMYLWISVGLA